MVRLIGRFPPYVNSRLTFGRSGYTVTAVEISAVVKQTMKKVDQRADKLAYQRLLKSYSKGALSRMVGITNQAVTRWEEVPLKYVRRISEVTGISKQDLRPSDFL